MAERLVYPCKTQGVESLFLHRSGNQVPLWKYNSVITWAVVAETFPSQEDAEYAVASTILALESWKLKDDALPFNFSFKQVKLSSDPSFVITFSRRPNGSTLALAFFPEDGQHELIIYPLQFTDQEKPFLSNTLAHELGHVMGLRHEFADEEGGAIQWGPRNGLSVMSYSHPPKVQPSDREWLSKLYDVQNPLMNIQFGFQSVPIQRFAPFNSSALSFERGLSGFERFGKPLDASGMLSLLDSPVVKASADSERAVFGLVKKEDNGIAFTPGKNCSDWVLLPNEVIHSIDVLCEVPCKDHTHYYVKLILRAPVTEEAVFYSDLYFRTSPKTDQNNASDDFSAWRPHIPRPPPIHFPPIELPPVSPCAGCIAVNMALAAAVVYSAGTLGSGIAVGDAVGYLVSKFGISVAVAQLALTGATAAVISAAICKC